MNFNLISEIRLSKPRNNRINQKGRGKILAIYK